MPATILKYLDRLTGEGRYGEGDGFAVPPVWVLNSTDCTPYYMSTRLYCNLRVWRSAEECRLGVYSADLRIHIQSSARPAATPRSAEDMQPCSRPHPEPPDQRQNGRQFWTIMGQSGLVLTLKYTALLLYTVTSLLTS